MTDQRTARLRAHRDASDGGHRFAGLGAWPAVVLLALLVAGPADAKTLRRPVTDGMVVALTPEHEIFLEAVPQKGEGLLAFSRRLCGSASASVDIASANDGHRSLRSGIRYRVPFDLLRPELQLSAMRSLFTDDEISADGWLHTTRAADVRQASSLWHVARWFTGDGDHFRTLRSVNRLAEEELAPGEKIVIPAPLLRPALRAALPRAETFRLDYGEDKAGPFAVYELAAGEALYSSVVVRFTGRLIAADVNELAREIAERNGIADVTDIPVGYPVKVPLDLLLPEYLPPGHPRREEYEAALRATAGFGNRVSARGLAGVTVVLDSGHGGADVGASFGGLWESLYVHDILLRVTHLLRSTTAAKVVTLVRDGDRSLPENADVLSYSRAHRVMTTPPYAIKEAAVGTNLRWYLANSVFRREMTPGRDDEKIVFVSIHADSLHPSVRGAMAYIPDTRLRAGTVRRTGEDYRRRQEYREEPSVSFSWRDRVRSEGLSRDLAEELIGAFRRNDLEIHPYKPVRSKIIRRRREYVPAVLRNNAIPAKVLLEVCNLANRDDRELLQTRAQRQRMAEAIVEGLLAYYGVDEPPSKTEIAAAR